MSWIGDRTLDGIEWMMENVLAPLFLVAIVGALLLGLLYAGSCAYERYSYGPCKALDPAVVEGISHRHQSTTYIKSGYVLLPITTPEGWSMSLAGERGEGRPCSISRSISRQEYDSLYAQGFR